MNSKDIPVGEIATSEQNERDPERVDHDRMDRLVENVRAKGIVQPVVVRENDDPGVPGEWEVIAGSRRVAAARAAGHDTVPARVVEWSDMEALEASITENLATVREAVPAGDRAVAIMRLLRWIDGGKSDLADRLGVAPSTITNWIEPGREEWSGTDVEPTDEVDAGATVDDLRGANSDSTDASIETSENAADELANEVSGSTLRSIRQATGGGEAGEEMAHRVAKGEMGRKDVREAAQETAEAVSEGNETDSNENGVSGASGDESGANTSGITTTVSYTLDDETGEALQSAAQAQETTPEAVAEESLSVYLTEQGWLA